MNRILYIAIVSFWRRIDCRVVGYYYHFILLPCSCAFIWFLLPVWENRVEHGNVSFIFRTLWIFAPNWRPKQIFYIIGWNAQLVLISFENLKQAQTYSHQPATHISSWNPKSIRFIFRTLFTLTGVLEKMWTIAVWTSNLFESLNNFPHARVLPLIQLSLWDALNVLP